MSKRTGPDDQNNMGESGGRVPGRPSFVICRTPERFQRISLPGDSQALAKRRVLRPLDALASYITCLDSAYSVQVDCLCPHFRRIFRCAIQESCSTAKPLILGLWFSSRGYMRKTIATMADTTLQPGRIFKETRGTVRSTVKPYQSCSQYEEG